MFIITLSIVLTVCSAYTVREPTELKPSSRIFGGQLAEPGFAPYQVSIQTLSFEHICGGAIISNKYILTAAHCIQSFFNQKKESNLQVATGTNRYETPDAVYKVSKLVPHCEYNKPSLHNDIALIRLSSPIVFNNLTQPILLPSEELNDGDEVILTGWGFTDFVSDTPDDLYKITLNYISHEKCLAALDNDPGLDIGHICTYTKKGEGTCYGDSGSPLVRNGAVYGVVNFGKPCATGKPDAQANTYFYTDWILTNMNDSD